MKTCERCRSRGKTWRGDDPKCAFPDDGAFQSDNWRCATMDALREVTEANARWSDEQSLGTLPVSGAFVVLSWYKRRGRTEGAWIVREGDMAPLTLDVAEWALAGGDA